MKMQGPSYFKYPWDIREQLPLDPAEQDTAATQPIAPVTDDDAALDADLEEYAAFLKRLLEENDDNGL